MNFRTHNDCDIDIDGTHLQGYVNATYDKLLDVFGLPLDGDGYKVDAEWGIRFDDGTVASIYNWKNGKNYCGPEGLDVDQITEWHVGGLFKESVRLVQQVLEAAHENV